MVPNYNYGDGALLYGTLLYKDDAVTCENGALFHEYGAFLCNGAFYVKVLFYVMVLFYAKVLFNKSPQPSFQA